VTFDQGFLGLLYTGKEVETPWEKGKRKKKEKEKKR